MRQQNLKERLSRRQRAIRLLIKRGKAHNSRIFYFLRKEFQGRVTEFRAKINEKKVEEDEDESGREEKKVELLMFKKGGLESGV